MGARSKLEVTGFVTVEECKTGHLQLPPDKTGHSQPHIGQSRGMKDAEES